MTAPALLHGSLPSPEQLGLLVERATRLLQPAEGVALRRGVQHLGRQLELAGVSLRRSAEELAVVRAELEAALRELGSIGPLAVACSFCGAEAGRKCRAVRGVEPPRTPHVARLTADARAGEQR